MLIILAGLPGTGKSTIARELARQLGAIHLRIDSIEQAIRDSGVVVIQLNDAGYRVGYAIAEENLRLGRTVIADSVNPLRITRNAWVAVAYRAQVDFLEIEIVCSDSGEHRRRLEARVTDIPGLKLPTWRDVAEREYDPWDRQPVVLDTAHGTLGDHLKTLVAAIERARVKESS